MREEMGEIARAGIQKLPGPVAQLVIVVHLTAASQAHAAQMHVQRNGAACVNRSPLF